uniref:Uncharacterized protein n=1 Tax=Glossina pallidipes TaxID=7398 RepID=A0A1A9ZV99_GLOPL
MLLVPLCVFIILPNEELEIKEPATSINLPKLDSIHGGEQQQLEKKNNFNWLVHCILIYLRDKLVVQGFLALNQEP